MMNFIIYSSFFALTLSIPVLRPAHTHPAHSLSKSIQPTTFSLPISKRELTSIPSPEELIIQLGIHADRTNRKYNIIGSNNKRSVSTLPLGDSQGDNEYFTTVIIGTPPVAFELAIDTGSADLIVQTVPCLSGCTVNTPLYRPSDSSTSVTNNEKFSITYQAGGAEGTVVTDVVSIGGFSATQSFGAVTNSSDSLSPGGVSGILGMAFQPLSSISQTPFLQSIFKAGKLSSPVFGVALATQGLTQQNYVTAGGSITIGGVDSTLFTGTINYNPVNSPYYWQITLDSMIIAGKTISVVQQTTIDTGTTNLYMPLKMTELFYSKIPQSRSIGGGLYIYPCGATLNVQFVFGGLAYSMSDIDFNIGNSSLPGFCVGALSSIGQSTAGVDTYIIGIAFLKNVYAAFRFSPGPSVGFAPLASNSATVLKSGIIPSGNALTIAEGGNLVTSKVPLLPIAAVIIASNTITNIASSMPTAIVVPVSTSISSSTSVVNDDSQVVVAPYSIGDLAASLQNGITNLILAIAITLKNTALSITCRGVIDKSSPAWRCSI